MNSHKIIVALITLLSGLYLAPCSGRTLATYYVNTDVSGPQDGLTEATGWEDWNRFVTWAKDENSPIDRDEAWTVHLSGSTPDTNTPVDCNIPTDKHHNIEWVGDLEGSAIYGDGTYYNLTITDTSQVIKWKAKLVGYEYDESYYNLTGSGALLAVDSNYMDFSGLQFNSESEVEDAVSLAGRRITMQNTVVRGGRYGIFADDPNLWLGIRNVTACDSATGLDAELKLRALVDLDRYITEKKYCPLFQNVDCAVQIRLPEEYDPD